MKPAAMHMNDQELEELVRQGETFHVEFKESLKGSAPKTIREAICAFANDLPDSRKPGVLFVGVDDDGKPTGLEITDSMLRQLADVKTDGQIVPPPSMQVEKRRLRGNDVAVAIVMPSDSPPVRYRGCIHVRIGPRRGTATAQDERILNEKRRSLVTPFDIQPVPSVDLSALNLRRFEEEYLPRAFNPEIIDANDRSTTERLAATKMIASADDPTPTLLGLLVLGNSPRDSLPNAWVQFLRIDGVELSDDIVDDEDIDGSLAGMLRRMDEKLRAHIRTRVDLKTADTEWRTASYPVTALREIVRNALMHRTYERTNAPVRVTWFNDRIEIQSPGGPFGSVTQENFGQPGFTDYRNPNLADAMKVLGFVQRFGVGIALAKKELQNAGHPDLEFRVNDQFVLAIAKGRRS